MEQSSLFPEMENDIEKEWHDMPEFVQEKKEPIKQLIISFNSWDDYKDFAKLIDQPLTPKTQSVFYPKVEIERYSNKVYEDEQ